VADRASVDIYDWVLARDSIRKIADTVRRSAALRELSAPRNGVPLFAERLFLGRTRTRASAVVLSDPAGRPRLRLLVDSLGSARIEFLDEAGAVVSRLPSTP
jgi:hypothetical protein